MTDRQQTGQSDRQKTCSQTATKRGDNRHSLAGVHVLCIYSIYIAKTDSIADEYSTFLLVPNCDTYIASILEENHHDYFCYPWTMCTARSESSLQMYRDEQSNSR